ncbi:hypothetical protein L6452_18138 [Arctium lappa]|uniref:Uncharacterized protein n=1 Tax=Arctium lappa TaxID=4217 RepID=A0ACB9C5H6_ARCLA|nr:hypothetical protein L6452_18138 [Arctium lappa]
MSLSFDRVAGGRELRAHPGEPHTPGVAGPLPGRPWHWAIRAPGGLGTRRSGHRVALAPGDHGTGRPWHRAIMVPGAPSLVRVNVSESQPKLKPRVFLLWDVMSGRGP